MKLSGRLVAVADLSPQDRAAMLALMHAHFAHVDASMFFEDLAEKQWVIQVIEPSTNLLRGFSTQMLLEANANGRPIRALFSGDTIVNRAYWGDAALSHVWGQLAISLIESQRDSELFWFLVSQGYRTYRFLPLFFHSFYPRASTPTPAGIDDAMRALAARKFGERFDPERGVIAANARQYRLQGDLATVPPGRMNDLHVRFYLRRNPGHARGDELCCLAPLSLENFTPAAFRVIGPLPSASQVFQWASRAG